MAAQQQQQQQVSLTVVFVYFLVTAAIDYIPLILVTLANLESPENCVEDSYFGSLAPGATTLRAWTLIACSLSLGVKASIVVMRAGLITDMYDGRFPTYSVIAFALLRNAWVFVGIALLLTTSVPQFQCAQWNIFVSILTIQCIFAYSVRFHFWPFDRK